MAVRPVVNVLLMSSIAEGVPLRRRRITRPCFRCLPEQSKRHPLAANGVHLLETRPAAYLLNMPPALRY